MQLYHNLPVRVPVRYEAPNHQTELVGGVQRMEEFKAGGFTHKYPFDLEHLACREKTIFIRVNQYKINHQGDKSYYTNPTEKDRAVSLARKSGFRKFSSDIAYSFFGKASPKQMQNALLAIYVSQNFSSIKQLQNYCDLYLGLDCSGFVGQYFETQGSSAGHNIIDIWNNSWQHRRKKKLDIKKDDVLIWCTSNGERKSSRHIAVINNLLSIQGPPLTNFESMKAHWPLYGNVVESTSGVGLTSSLYIFNETKNEGVFNVVRGCKPHLTTYVRVFPVI